MYLEVLAQSIGWIFRVWEIVPLESHKCFWLEENPQTWESSRDQLCCLWSIVQGSPPVGLSITSQKIFRGVLVSQCWRMYLCNSYENFDVSFEIRAQ